MSGVLHGYEIKSNRDRLTRLASQAETYSRVLDRVTLVVCPRHIEAALQLVPSWWGVLLVRGSVEAVSLDPFRPAVGVFEDELDVPRVQVYRFADDENGA